MVSCDVGRSPEPLPGSRLRVPAGDRPSNQPGLVCLLTAVNRRPGIPLGADPHASRLHPIRRQPHVLPALPATSVSVAIACGLMYHTGLILHEEHLCDTAVALYRASGFDHPTLKASAVHPLEVATPPTAVLLVTTTRANFRRIYRPARWLTILVFSGATPRRAGRNHGPAGNHALHAVGDSHVLHSPDQCSPSVGIHAQRQMTCRRLPPNPSLQRTN